MAPLNDIDFPWMEHWDNRMTVHALTPEKIPDNDLDKVAQKKRVEKLKTFSHKCFYSKLAYVGWRNIPSTYFHCFTGSSYSNRCLGRDGGGVGRPASDRNVGCVAFTILCRCLKKWLLV
jgi:hypothetical protein